MLSKIIGCATLLAFADAVRMSSADSEDTVINAVSIPTPPMCCCVEEILGAVLTVDGYPFVCEKTDFASGHEWMCPSPGSYVTQEDGDQDLCCN